MTDRDDFDSPWKEILNTYFQEFMEFFFPDIADEIDWTRGYEPLDKELHQITRDAEIGFRYADKLFKVYRKNGEEAWVLAHVEIQAQEQEGFGRRMFVYFYRIRDLYNRPVVSLAVLADNNPKWYVSDYKYELWGCSSTFQFPAVKILDFKDRWNFLKTSSNLFAVVVMAHLRTMETKKDYGNRLQYKLGLSKALYRQGWTREKIYNLYRFIDWLMVLPGNMEKHYHKEILNFEQEVKMPYVTTAERIGKEKGRKETVHNLLLLGILTDKQIAQVSGLSVEEVCLMKQDQKQVSGKTAAADC